MWIYLLRFIALIAEGTNVLIYLVLSLLLYNRSNESKGVLGLI